MNAGNGNTTVGPETIRIAPISRAMSRLMPPNNARRVSGTSEDVVGGHDATIPTRRPRHTPQAVDPRLYHPSRYLPTFHWELLACGFRGHLLVGTDVARVGEEDAAIVREEDGIRWHRCLRCDAWVPLPPPVNASREHMPSRDDITLPLRGRAMRDLIVLRLIAVDRAIHFVVLALLATAVLLFANDQKHLRDLYETFMRGIEGVSRGPLPEHHGILGEIDQAVNARHRTLYLIAGGLGFYALIEGVEAIGLWLMKRWAEYLTFLATALFLPWEISELINRVSPFKVIAITINIAVLAYLLWAKRLFGIRGGYAREEELRYAECGWEAIERTAPAHVAGGADGGTLRVRG
jgi:uncharacterized membrane protein (DUF2068 family)